MSNEARLHLVAAINATIGSYSERAAQNRSYAFIGHIVTTALGALTTIVIGLNAKDPSETLNAIALILSAVMTFNHALSSYFNNKEFWIEFNEKANDLRKLKFDIDMELTRGPLSNEQLDQFKLRYQAIVDSMNSFWKFNRSKKASDSSHDQA